MRGEYHNRGPWSNANLELPPRARRIPQVCLGVIRQSGTTSACAENTIQTERLFHDFWNYLRVRGEYAWLMNSRNPPRELPPRARRIPEAHEIGGVKIGTTSACAENTPETVARGTKIRNYLRVRGEYSPRSISPGEPTELPPRARRILLCRWPRWKMVGTTSACAENTLARQTIETIQRNYLRVRGEYFRGLVRVLGFWELPPRARRIRHSSVATTQVYGTTSACAENTLNELGLL